MFALQDLDTAILISGFLKDFYTGDSALYKNQKDNTYHLVVRQGAHSLSEFHKIYNTISEYTKSEPYTPGAEAYYREHGKTILNSHALQKLTELSSIS